MLNVMRCVIMHDSRCFKCNAMQLIIVDADAQDVICMDLPFAHTHTHTIFCPIYIVVHWALAVFLILLDSALS